MKLKIIPLAMCFPLLFLFSGCASSRLSASNDAAPSASRGGLLFPPGNYQHQVQLKFNRDDPQKMKSYHLIGYVKIEPNFIQTVGISPLGFSVFKIQDHLKTEQNPAHLQVEIFLDPLKKFQDKIEAYYQVLRKVLTLSTHQTEDDSLHWDESTPEGYPLKMTYQENSAEASTLLSMSDYDAQHIPRKLKLENPHFEVIIEVSHD